MRLLLINSVCGTGSTGRICAGIAKDYIEHGNDVKIAFGRDRNVPEECRKYAVRIGSDFSVMIHGVLSKIFDVHGLGSRRATKKFLKWAEGYDPDELWLHNLHGYYINYQLLFNWIKSRPSMKVKWTLHDCWAFTGHCTHFTVARCDKWVTECESCPQRNKYPSSILFDQSKKNYIKKKESFTNVKDMTIIVPSEWLAKRVKKSFLSNYKIKVIPNEIDHSVFRPIKSDFKISHGFEDKIMVLGVAAIWTYDKGINDIKLLSELLPDNYIMVIVGAMHHNCLPLPDKIYHIERTDDPISLAKIYSAADVFVCASREETFGMTTAEALSCGTPAVVYKDTACEETAHRMGGIAVDNNIEALRNAILELTALHII